MPKTDFSEAYKIKCRAIWYQNECPSPRKCLELDIMPADELGRMVEKGTLEHWVDSWVQWRDAMDADLSTKVEEALLASRVEIIKEQLKQSREIRNKAFNDIKDKSFDSSAAAVSAFFKASAEERGLMQVQKVIEDLSKLESGKLQEKFRLLAERASATTTEDKEESAEPND